MKGLSRGDRNPLQVRHAAEAIDVHTVLVEQLLVIGHTGVSVTDQVAQPLIAEGLDTLSRRALKEMPPKTGEWTGFVHSGAPSQDERAFGQVQCVATLAATVAAMIAAIATRVASIAARAASAEGHSSVILSSRSLRSATRFLPNTGSRTPLT